MEWYFLVAIFITGNIIGQYLTYKYYQRKRLAENKYFSSFEEVVISNNPKEGQKE